MPTKQVAPKPKRVYTTRIFTQQSAKKITKDKTTKQNNDNVQPNKRKPKQQRNDQSQQSQTNGNQPRKPVKKSGIATGPNYTESGNNRYRIGHEYDARNHMGWRRIEKVGSSVQFLYIPKMVNRVDQAYYRRQHTDEQGIINTFAVGIFVQDSTLPRNVLRDPKLFKTQHEKDVYLENLSKAFESFLLRTKDALQNDTAPSLLVDAE